MPNIIVFAKLYLILIAAVFAIATESYPPPEDIRLVDANSSQLTFQWSSISANCSAIHYYISASSCGHCPIKSNQTTATCTGMYVDGQVCRFSLQTVVCNDIFGNESTKVEVNLQGKVNNCSIIINVYENIL